LIELVCYPLLDLPSCHDLQYLIDQFHAIGIKNDLLANAFYRAALQKSIIIFKYKHDLYSLEKDDPICVTTTIEQKLIVQNRHDLCYEQMKNLFSNALQLSSLETRKIKVNMGYTYYFLFGYYYEAIDIMKIIIEDYNMNK
jgi:predicted enzyme involved in methoxymalonyl-ACP biosynthesis